MPPVTLELRDRIVAEKLPMKEVGHSIYIHIDSLVGSHSGAHVIFNEILSNSLGDSVPCFNILKIENYIRCISLLNYPSFFEEAFPPLSESWKIDVSNNSVSYRTYADSLNPPILHRKELLVGPSHSRYQEYRLLTETAESLGLFDSPKKIGYFQQWNSLIKNRGFRIEGHSLLPIGNLEFDEEIAAKIEKTDQTNMGISRHRTAINRSTLSAPIQTLGRYGYLDPEFLFFDYGSGHGTDVEALRNAGINANGWDPYFAPENEKRSADIVNLGFVVNVIEDFDERVEALESAWHLAEKLLVVSVMLENLNRNTGQRYGDGVLSSRNTFQKYYSQNEIRYFVDEVLGLESIAVAPGIIYAFRDKSLEQDFLLKRYSRNRVRSRLSPIRVSLAPRLSKRDKQEKFYQDNQELLDKLWSTWLELGRRPDAAESPELDRIVDIFGSLKKGLNFLERFHGTEGTIKAADARLDDLKVYLASGIFEQRSPYKDVNTRIKRDIKYFFGSIRNAKESATQLLYEIADVEKIEEACKEAYEHGLGWLEEGESLQLHSSMIDQLPAVLRLYVGCASIYFGDVRSVDLVKIHIHSGKLSLMKFDDFESKAVPRMLERMKIKFREREIEYFDYVDEFEPPYLYYKSRFINEEFPNYPEQLALEEQLDDLDVFDFSGYGPPPKVFNAKLVRMRIELNGYELLRGTNVPQLDDECGHYLTFRDLIECGGTFAKESIENLPKQADSYNALLDLALNVLDPVIDYFGMVKLTYGFCSAELSKKIPGRIAPKLDQHAACETDRNGKFICGRLGAAADFIVEDEDMLEVAQWIVKNTTFDRLYFYGRHKPLHVSYGPEAKRQVVLMSYHDDKRLIPKVIDVEKFQSYDVSDDWF